MTVYLDLTREFNAGGLRAILTSGQAVVLYRLAVMSKDGAWILREEDEALSHVLRVLGRRGARYRFGAPLDARWLAGGWSAHFEFAEDGLRVRTDFFTRPPRVSSENLARLWRDQEGRDPAFVDVKTLAEMKKTDREKDYAVLGELARLMSDPRDQLLYSRSALDLIELVRQHPSLQAELAFHRPLLTRVADGRERLEVELDAERRSLMRANERRLEAFQAAAVRWKSAWPALSQDIDGLDLDRAHARVVERAKELLPFRVEDAAP